MRWLTSLFGSRSHGRLFRASTQTQPAQDALAAIEDLTRAIKHNPGAVEICSALGNLYRLRGELDRAIQIRSGLIVRPNLTSREKARVYFELGRDYARAGLLDRAQEAFLLARKLTGPDMALEQELAGLFAKGGEFLEASRHYQKIGAKVQAAHFLVRAACSRDGAIDRGLIREALELYPASPEGWLETIGLLVRTGAWDELPTQLRQGLAAIGPELRFLLLDPLLDHDETKAPPSPPAGWIDIVLGIIDAQPQNLPLIHYSGRLLRAHGRIEEAKTWQEKALLLNPSFWPARLELLTMTMPEQHLTPVFELQLDFLLRRARQVKRFVCSKCGLKRRDIFFCCPKCLSWHSISFRQLLSDS